MSTLQTNVPAAAAAAHQVDAAIPAAELHVLFEASVVDGSSRINYEQFIAAMLDSHRVIQRPAALRRSFEMLDKDGDGVISSDDLASHLEALQRQQEAGEEAAGAVGRDPYAAPELITCFAAAAVAAPAAGERGLGEGGAWQRRAGGGNRPRRLSQLLAAEMLQEVAGAAGNTAGGDASSGSANGGGSRRVGRITFDDFQAIMNNYSTTPTSLSTTATSADGIRP